MGDQGQVIIEVIPELERIIGKQPPVQELAGTSAQNRFNLLFQKFIQVFTTKEHPLVIFLDDLQWADSASLKLMQLLMSETETRYLLLIGAYRDNEVQAAHPLILTLGEIQKADATINTINLAPLKPTDLNHLIADTLSCSSELALPLTELVNLKTKGNPFFATQFLKSLYEDGFITFNFEDGYWQCDIAKVRELSLTDDVVEFMILQLQKLPEVTQEVLKLAACIGNQFDLGTLSIVQEKPQTETAANLWKALQEALIIPVSEVYKFFQDGEGKVFNQLPITDYQLPSYKFLHDRVQQAAYSLITEHHKKSTHLQIGRLLFSHIEPQEREEKIFEIVNQLNYGIELITLQKERDELAHLNVLAGRKAKAATAYEAAMTYFTVGNQLLGENRWETNYDLTLSLSESAAEVAYLNGNFDEIDRWVVEVLQQAKIFLDKIKVYEVKIKSLQSENKLRESLTAGLEVLNQLGVIFPETPSQPEVQKELAQTNTLLAGREINQLIHLPKMTDVGQLAAMEICTYMMGAVYQSAPEMLPLIVLKMVNLSLEYGNTDFSADGYVLYALILCGIMGEIELGYQYGTLAMKLLEELNAQQLECRVSFTFNCCVRPWQEPLKETIYPLAKAYQIGRERGDIDYASISSFYECLHLTWSGRELPEIERKIANYSQALRQVHQQTPLNYHAINWQFVLNLLETTANPCCLSGLAYQEKIMLPMHQQVNDYPALAYLHIKKLILCYLFGEFDLALEISPLAQQYSVALAGVVAAPIVCFYESLTILAAYFNSSLSQQESWLKTVTSNQEKMQKWAHHAPMNFMHKFYLVEAERYRVLGQKIDAVEMYDRAIKIAKENEYINEEALANELAAKFYLEWGKEKIAQTYLIEAYYCYARWGAKAKVDDLEQRYPDLLAPILFREKIKVNSITTNSIASETFTSTSTGGSALLDLTTVMKAAQNLSEEIVLEQLLSTLMQVLIENAGAENGCLILPKDGNLVIEAAQSSRITQANVLQSIPIESSSMVPVTVINYVWRTQKSLVTNDATTINRFASDPYIIQRQPKSLLCSPIVNRGKLIGIVYLENNLIAGAFTSDRINILNLLTSQAAISLENARLYQNLQLSEASQREKAERLAETLKILHHETRKIEFRAEIDSALTQIDTLPVILTRCTDAVVKHLDAAFARIWTLNAKENILELQASSGLYTHINGSHSRIPVGKFKIGWIAQTRQPHLTNDVCNDLLISDRDWARREGMVSFAGYPLTIEGQFVGVIAMFSRQALNDSILKVLKLASYEIASGIRRKQVEEALQESELQLRHKAQHLEQTLHQLQQAQLQMIQSEKMSALGNLVAGVAHEINNPVGFISGNINEATAALKDLIAHLNLYQQALPHPSEQIVQDAEDIDLEYLLEDLPKMLQSMKVGCDRIRNISTSLRTFSRADSGSKVSANLHEGIDSTLMILQYRLKANETRPAIEVIKDYGEIPKVKCYFGQLNQVFMNVIANAIDALEESNYKRDFAAIKANPNQIAIKTQLSADRQSVEIKIKDNANGMPEEVKCCIFEHLFTTKGVGKGTGLGLSISRQIIEETHGGSLTCNSVLGEGTEFTIVLPIDDAIRLTPH